jgi:tRNA 2-thiouridine synthesizing protein A
MHTALGIGCICGKSAFALWYIAHQENSLSKIMTTEPKPASNPASKSTGLEIVELDVTGLNCPMPLLKAKKALNEMQAHQQLRVRATDPGSVRDFEVFTRQSGHQLLESNQQGDVYCYLLQKKG